MNRLQSNVIILLKYLDDIKKNPKTNRDFRLLSKKNM